MLTRDPSDVAFIKGYNDAKDGICSPPPAEWDSPEVQGYSRGWSEGNFVRIKQLHEKARQVSLERAAKGDY